jgi:hypothetical protein
LSQISRRDESDRDPQKVLRDSAHGFVPETQRCLSTVSVIGSAAKMSANVECVVGGFVHREKTLRCAGRPETLHPALATPHIYMRAFDPIVLPTRLVVPDGQA